ncbi:MAG: hypothetical protein D6793_03040 [Thermoflexia bacterium]|nr:MAG: hypothetical protein D6793_03040 [Thermoflexia bacterium]
MRGQVGLVVGRGDQGRGAQFPGRQGQCAERAAAGERDRKRIEKHRDGQADSRWEREQQTSVRT